MRHASSKLPTWICLIALTLALSPAGEESVPRTSASESDHDHDHGHDHDESARDEHDDESRFTVADFERHGVSVAVVAAGTVDLGIELPGEVRPNADRTAHLAPRFAGLVREVRKRVGDQVRAGDTLAIVEGDTLSRFAIVAPFDGVVIDRSVALGEAVVPDKPIMIIADLATVWVDVAVYQKDLGLVRAGQAVTVSAGYGVPDGSGAIAYITPTVDHATRTATARVPLDNADGRWRPGQFVTAVVERPEPASVVVERDALQRTAGGTVVFVERDGTYAPQPVTIGRLGRTKVEITTGLTAGQRYASSNSFLVRAELEKGAGGHDH